MIIEIGQIAVAGHLDVELVALVGFLRKGGGQGAERQHQNQDERENLFHEFNHLSYIGSNLSLMKFVNTIKLIYFLQKPFARFGTQRISSARFFMPAPRKN